jgi:hypothetical protein
MIIYIILLVGLQTVISESHISNVVLFNYFFLSGYIYIRLIGKVNTAMNFKIYNDIFIIFVFLFHISLASRQTQKYQLL